MRRQWQALGGSGRSKIFVVRKEEGKDDLTESTWVRKVEGNA